MFVQTRPVSLREKIGRWQNLFYDQGLMYSDNVWQLCHLPYSAIRYLKLVYSIKIINH